MSTLKNVRVSVAQGTVVGLQDTLPNGQAFYSFKGIPYAQPPINDLRFKVHVCTEAYNDITLLINVIILIIIYFFGIRRAHQPPVPLDTFSEPLLDCTEERSVSYQKDALTAKMVGSEDCLFLNVYIPTTVGDAVQSQQRPLPVMLWIHGGAYMSGSGNSD